MFLVPFTVDVERFARLCAHSRPQRDTLRRSFGVKASTVVLYVGTLNRVKDPSLLLEAFCALSQDVNDFCLVLAGDGPLMKVLQQYALQHDLIGRITFLGFVNQEELPKVYACADLMVVPSRSDTWARSVNEAMACGLPIIASRKVGATGDIVRDGVNGFVIPEGDAQELAAKMRILVQDAELRARMGQASREIISTWTYEAGVPNALKAIEYACRRKSTIP
jgi:glycosyltransferase involved in cell wall biosynthesis